MDRRDKEVFVEEMKDRLKRAKATFVVDYQGLNVEAMNKIRLELRKAETEFFVVKNRLLKLASDDTETASIEKHLRGPCALAITYEDLIKPAKALLGLSKQYEKLKIKAGQMSGRPMDPDAIKRLAELPGRDELLAQVFSAMQAVPTSLVRVLSAVLSNLMNVLKAIERKKGENGQEAAS